MSVSFSLIAYFPNLDLKYRIRNKSLDTSSIEKIPKKFSFNDFHIIPWCGICGWFSSFFPLSLSTKYFNATLYHAVYRIVARNIWAYHFWAGCGWAPYKSERKVWERTLGVWGQSLHALNVAKGAKPLKILHFST